MKKMTMLGLFVLMTTLIATSAWAENCTGCTPGYWKQSQHFWAWDYTPYQPSDTVAATFGSTAGCESFTFTQTLLQALQTGGGGQKALLRHAVATLLNANHAGLTVAIDDEGVKTLFCSAMASGEYEATKNYFEERNEKYCPLGNAPVD